jgi:hypothetical protein
MNLNYWEFTFYESMKSSSLVIDSHSLQIVIFFLSIKISSQSDKFLLTNGWDGQVFADERMSRTSGWVGQVFADERMSRTSFCWRTDESDKVVLTNGWVGQGCADERMSRWSFSWLTDEKWHGHHLKWNTNDICVKHFFKNADATLKRRWKALHLLQLTKLKTNKTVRERHYMFSKTDPQFSPRTLLN